MPGNHTIWPRTFGPTIFVRQVVAGEGQKKWRQRVFMKWNALIDLWLKSYNHTCFTSTVQATVKYIVFMMICTNNNMLAIATDVITLKNNFMINLLVSFELIPSYCKYVGTTCKTFHLVFNINFLHRYLCVSPIWEGSTPRLIG